MSKRPLLKLCSKMLFRFGVRRVPDYRTHSTFGPMRFARNSHIPVLSQVSGQNCEETGAQTYLIVSGTNRPSQGCGGSSVRFLAAANGYVTELPAQLPIEGGM